MARLWHHCQGVVYFAAFAGVMAVILIEPPVWIAYVIALAPTLLFFGGLVRYLWDPFTGVWHKKGGGY